MSESVPQVQCGACGASIDEPPDTKSDERKPCPSCGSTIRQIRVELADTLEFHESLSYKARKQGESKPHLEGRSGDDLHRKTGKWMLLERIIDRARDWYKELVTDPETGKVVHRCEEPLSKHRGHGNAKKKS